MRRWTRCKGANSRIALYQEVSYRLFQTDADCRRWAHQAATASNARAQLWVSPINRVRRSPNAAGRDFTLLDDQLSSSGRSPVRGLRIRRRTESPHTRRTPKIGGGAGMSSSRNATMNGRGRDSASVTRRTTIYELSERTASRMRRAPSPLLDDGSQRLARPGGRGRTMSQRLSSGSALLRLM